MCSLIYFTVLFLAKVFDNALSTAKTILIQRSRWLLAGVSVVLSDFIYFWLTLKVKRNLQKSRKISTLHK